MKLHSPQFEKNLRRAVKTAVRRSPELKREYRQSKKARRRAFLVVRYSILPMVRAASSVFVGLFVSGFIENTGHPATGLAVINLWSLVVLCFLAPSLLSSLFHASDLPALSLLPVSESTIFRWELQRFLKKHALFCLWDQCAGFVAWGLASHISGAQWVWAIMLVILSWVALVSLVAFCAARLPMGLFVRMAGMICTVGFVLLFTHKWIGHAVLMFIDRVAPTLNLLLPTGWTPSLSQLLLPHGTWVLLALLVPIIGIICTTRNSLECLRSRMVYQEHPPIPQAPDQIPGVAPASRPDQPPRAGVTEIEEIIQTRQFLSQPQPTGRLERWWWQRLTPRERALTEFAFPNGFQLTKGWLGIWRTFLLTVLIGFAAGMISRTVEFWVFGIGLFVTFTQLMAQICSKGAAFRGLFSSGVVIPIYAAYPVGFRELSRMLFKLSLIQLPLLVSYAMAVAILMAQAAKSEFVLAITLGFKTGFLIFFGQFIVTTLAFSAGTDDTAHFRWQTIALLLLFIVGGGLFLLLGVTGLFMQKAWVAWLLWLAALFESYAIFRMYGWFYHTNRFDLMKISQR